MSSVLNFWPGECDQKRFETRAGVWSGRLKREPGKINPTGLKMSRGTKNDLFENNSNGCPAYF